MDSSSNSAASRGKCNTYNSVKEKAYKGAWLKEGSEYLSIRSGRHFLLATLSACAGHCWENAAEILPLLFLQIDSIPMNLLLNLTNAIVRNSDCLSHLKDSIYENFTSWSYRKYVTALGMINDELPDISHENIPAFIEKIDSLCIAGEKARGQTNMKKFSRYKLLTLGYTALIMFCYYKEEYERQYGELQDLTETEHDQGFQGSKQDEKEEARKQARIGFTRVLEKFSWALQVCEEPCEWLMEPYLHTLKIIHGNKTALEALESYVEKNSSHLPAHKLAYQFTKLCPESGAFQQKELEEIVKLCPDDPLVITYAEDLLDKGDDVETHIKIINMLMDMIEFKEWRWDIKPWKMLCYSIRNIHVKSVHSSSEESSRIKDELQNILKERTPLWKAYVWIFPEFSHISVDQAEVLFYSTYTAFVLQYDENYTKLMEKVFANYGYQVLAEDLKNAKQCSERQLDSFLRNFTAYKNSERSLYSKEDMYGNMKIKNSDNNEKDCHTSWLKCNLGKYNHSALGTESTLECQDIHFNDADILTSTQVSVGPHGSPLSESIGMWKSPKLSGLFQDSYLEFGGGIPCGQMDPVLQKVDIEKRGCGDSDNICINESQSCVLPDLYSVKNKKRNSDELRSPRGDEASDEENVIGPSQTTDLSFEPKTLNTSFSKTKKDLSDVIVENSSSDTDMESSMFGGYSPLKDFLTSSSSTPKNRSKRKSERLKISMQICKKQVHEEDDPPVPIYPSQTNKEYHGNTQKQDYKKSPDSSFGNSLKRKIDENVTSECIHSQLEVSGNKDECAVMHSRPTKEDTGSHSIEHVEPFKNWLSLTKRKCRSDKKKKLDTPGSDLAQQRKFPVYEMDDLPFPLFQSQMINDVEVKEWSDNEEVLVEDAVPKRKEVNVKGVKTKKSRTSRQESKRLSEYEVDDLPFPQFPSQVIKKELDNVPAKSFRECSNANTSLSFNQASETSISQNSCSSIRHKHLSAVESENKEILSGPKDKDGNSGNDKYSNSLRDISLKRETLITPKSSRKKHKKSSDYDDDIPVSELAEIPDKYMGQDKMKNKKNCTNSVEKHLVTSVYDVDDLPFPVFESQATLEDCEKHELSDKAFKECALDSNKGKSLSKKKQCTPKNLLKKYNQELLFDSDDLPLTTLASQAQLEEPESEIAFKDSSKEKVSVKSHKELIDNSDEHFGHSTMKNQVTCKSSSKKRQKSAFPYKLEDLPFPVFESQSSLEESESAKKETFKKTVGELVGHFTDEIQSIENEKSSSKKKKKTSISFEDLNSETSESKQFVREDKREFIKSKDVKPVEDSKALCKETSSEKKRKMSNFQESPRKKVRLENVAHPVKPVEKISADTGGIKIKEEKVDDYDDFICIPRYIQSDIGRGIIIHEVQTLDDSFLSDRNTVDGITYSELKEGPSYVSQDFIGNVYPDSITVKKDVKNKKDMKTHLLVSTPVGSESATTKADLDVMEGGKEIEKNEERKQINVDNSDISTPTCIVEIDTKKDFDSKLTQQEAEQSKNPYTKNFSVLESNSVKSKSPGFVSKGRFKHKKTKFTFKGSSKFLDRCSKIKLHFSEGIGHDAPTKESSRTEIMATSQKNVGYFAGNNIHVDKDIKKKCKNKKAKNIMATVECKNIVEVLESSGIKKTSSHTTVDRKGDICSSVLDKKKRKDELGENNVLDVKKKFKKNKKRIPKNEVVEKVSIGISHEEMNLQNAAFGIKKKKKKKKRKRISVDNSDISKPVRSVEMDMERGFHSKLTSQEVKQNETPMTQNFSLLESNAIKTQRPAFVSKKKPIHEKRKFIYENGNKFSDRHKKESSRAEIVDMSSQKNNGYSAENNIHLGKDIKRKKEKAKNIKETVDCKNVTEVLESSGTKKASSHANLYTKDGICSSSLIKKKRREEPGISIGVVNKVKKKKKKRNIKKSKV